MMEWKDERGWTHKQNLLFPGRTAKQLQMRSGGEMKWGLNIGQRLSSLQNADFCMRKEAFFFKNLALDNLVIRPLGIFCSVLTSLS